MICPRSQRKADCRVSIRPQCVYLCVNEERQHQHGQQEVRERQAYNEVVGGSFESLLQVHAHTHQHVPTSDGNNQQDPEHQSKHVVMSGRSRSPRIGVRICEVLRHVHR